MIERQVDVSYRPRRAHLRGNGDVIGGLVHDARYSLPYLHSPLKVGVSGSAVSSPGRVRIRMHFCAISAQKWPLVALKSGRGVRVPRVPAKNTPVHVSRIVSCCERQVVEHSIRYANRFESIRLVKKIGLSIH